MRLNGSFTPPDKTYVPDFLDLAQAAVGGIQHDEFTVKIRQLDAEEIRLVLEIQSESRHYTLLPVRLRGTETMAEILETACGLIQCAMAQDARFRFRFHGSPIFATAGE